MTPNQMFLNLIQIITLKIRNFQVILPSKKILKNLPEINTFFASLLHSNQQQCIQQVMTISDNSKYDLSINSSIYLFKNK